MQEKYGLVIGQPAPRPNSITAEYKTALPHIDLLIETQNQASKLGIDRAPVGLEVKYNEFAKIIFTKCQEMVAKDLDPKAVAKDLQKAVEDLQK